MSAAATQTCGVCKQATSKYKCPRCGEPTCSLACSKEHKGVRHAEHADGQSASSSASALLAPTLQVGQQSRLTPPDAKRFQHINRYVPMNRYGEANLMEDVEYLHFVGQSVSAIGREIAKRGWLKVSGEQENARKGPPYDRPRTGPSDRQQRQQQPAEIRNRQQFETWLRRLRLPIMLLPDGMTARKENQSRYRAHVKQLQCTVQIAFPCAAPAAGENDRRARRALLHHVSWNRPLGEVAMAEVSRRMAMRTDGVAAEEVVRSGYRALLGREMESVGGGKQVTVDEARGSIMLAVPLHSDRLRNETSAKFLEWWQRQARNGLVKADGLELDEEKRTERERIRRGDWAPIDGLAEEHDGGGAEEIGTAQGSLTAAAHSATPSNPGLISAALLHRMQAQRATQAEREEAVLEGPEKTTEELLSSGQRSLLVLKGDETIEQVLAGLDKGLAIVEYPHVEVWDRRTLLRLFDEGKAKRESLVGGGHTTEPEPANTTAKAAQPTTTKPDATALIGLSAYASSDEE